MKMGLVRQRSFMPSWISRRAPNPNNGHWIRIYFIIYIELEYILSFTMHEIGSASPSLYANSTKTLNGSSSFLPLTASWEADSSSHKWSYPSWAAESVHCHSVVWSCSCRWRWSSSTASERQELCPWKLSNWRSDSREALSRIPDT